MKSRRILVVSFLLVAASAIGANAQSLDRDSPTPVSENTIKGGERERARASLRATRNIHPKESPRCLL